jgi:putative transposase
MKTFEYRLRPNVKQELRLFASLRSTRELYNQCLEELITHYKNTGKSLNRFAQDKLHGKKEHPEMMAVLVDTTIARLHKSFANFFRRLKKGGVKAGFPRFKSANHWRSIEFRDATHHLDGGYFKSGKGCAGNIRTVVHRPLKGVFKHARIIKRPSGWYLQCVCETTPEPLVKTGNEIGLDVGIKYLIADSNGNFIDNDKTLRKNLAKLRIKQRAVARKTKGSHGRWKSVRELARLHERIANRRKDYIHKATTKIVQGNDLIAMEDLQIGNMAKNHCLALSISDASWGMIRQMLSFKAENAGRTFITVPPQYTSQKCSNCGEYVQKSLSVRTHLCPMCGYTADRDVNAAKNILRLGRSLYSLSP